MNTTFEMTNTETISKKSLIIKVIESDINNPMLHVLIIVWTLLWWPGLWSLSRAEIWGRSPGSSAGAGWLSVLVCKIYPPSPWKQQTSMEFLQWRQHRQWVAVEGQSGQLPQPPEGVEDGPVGQLVTVEVEQPGGSIGVSSVSLSHLRHPSASSILQSYSL